MKNVNVGSLCIRKCVLGDAAQFVEFARKVGTETKFTRFSSGTVPSIEKSAAEFEEDGERSDRLHLGAFAEDRLVAYAKFRQPYPDHSGFKHVADFGIMVLSEFWGKGVGRALMDAVEDYSKRLGVTRIEARVRQGNDAALKFFGSLGYVVEGTRRACVVIDQFYLDEYYIGKVL
jgi:RimJ/RimL family protein N-acetyltransferase